MATCIQPRAAASLTGASPSAKASTAPSHDNGPAGPVVRLTIGAPRAAPMSTASDQTRRSSGQRRVRGCEAPGEHVADPQPGGQDLLDG